MNTAVLISGIILMVIGVGIFFSINPNVEKCTSLIGQIGQGLSNDTNTGCDILYSLQTVSAIMLVVGIGITIAGAVMKPNRLVGKILLGTIISVISFIVVSMVFPFPYGLIGSIVIVVIVVLIIKKGK